MTQKISNILNVLKIEKWKLPLLTLFYFVLFYIFGKQIEPYAYEWIWSDDYDDWYRNTANLARLESVMNLFLSGKIGVGIATLWAISPVLVSLCFSLAMVNMQYLFYAKRREGKKYIGETIYQLLGIVIIIYFILAEFFK